MVATLHVCNKYQNPMCKNKLTRTQRTARCRVGVIKILIVINCNLITFSKVIACNCNKDISLITVIECN